jgi:hypothetical protein
VGMSDLPSQIVWHRIMVGGYDTGMDLLIEAVHALDMAGDACEAPEDAARFSALADRVRSYLAVSRPTTTLGMPRIPPDDNRLTDESVIHRSGGVQQSHIRVLPS